MATPDAITREARQSGEIVRVIFLGAKLPLTKTIACRNEQFSVAPYPHVSRLTSYQEEVTTLPEFEAALRKHAALEHCLFNGQLTQPLTEESRAGKTLKNSPRHWIVFDFDKIEAKDHADAVAKYLPPECQTVSYIAQYSASMFRPSDKPLFSGHVYMLLKEASNETQLKSYIEALNFSLPALRAAISLTDSGLALHWPLDRSATYDSKLIYIAPPKCHGFEPAIRANDAIKLVKKKLPSLKLPIFQPIGRHEIEGEINAHRARVGLPAHDMRTRPFEDGEVLLGVERGLITDMKPMGDHYIKFNLNGGDSLGYWLDLRNPSVIKNFKGEPWMMTKEVDPDVFKALSKTAPHAVSKPPLNPGTEILAFYTTNQNSKVKIGTFSAQPQALVLNNSTETAAKAFLAEYGLVNRGFLPHMDLIFDPQCDIQYVSGATTINTFTPTKYMQQTKSAETASTLKEIPFVINKWLTSLLGNPSPEIYSHFINWLAYIFQKREKAGTAWVWSGRTGTGKGSFIRYVLSPLLGPDAVVVKQYGVLKEEFNGYLERALLVVFDECDVNAVPNQSELMSKLQHWITDSPLSIRRMNTDHFEVPSYANFIFLTNKRTSVVVTSDDRRFSISDRQENKLFYTPNEMLALQRGDALEAFADVLLRWPVNSAAAHDIIKTQASEDIHEATTTINQLIAEAILRGDLQFFLDRAPSDTEAVADFHNRFNPSGLFKAQLDKYIAAAATGAPVILKDEDLFVLFRTLIPDTRYFQDSKTWRKRHYKSLGVDVDKVHRSPGEWDKKERGLKITWVLPAGVQPPMQAKNVTSIKSRKRDANTR